MENAKRKLNGVQFMMKMGSVKHAKLGILLSREYVPENLRFQLALIVLLLMNMDVFNVKINII